jgi:lipopolysaccharide/colanic/teichoic acid biosynthesis glycosyltransferase
LIYFISKVSNKKTDFRKFILGVPQIFIGKASFVGPQTLMNNGKLYLGKRGLTGLWYTEDADAKDNEKLDIFYAKNQNVWLDLEILGKTLNKMWETRS